MILALGAAAKAWLGSLAMIAGQGTLLALVALALTRAGKLRPSWQAALWLVVIVKFALPWSPALPWSLADLVAALAAHGHAGGDVALAAAHAAAAPPKLGAAIAWLAIGAAWVAIASAILVRGLLAYRRAARGARAGAPAPDDAHALLAALAARAGVRAPKLVVGDAATGPHVIGLVRPTIVVPPSLLGEPTLLRATLLHELAHVRRRDALGRAVQVWAGAALFFWPVVRLVARKLDLARESACDAWALDAGDIARPSYAKLLVRMAELRAAQPALAAPHALDRRIAAVLGADARPGLGRGQRVVLAVWGVLALGGARTAEARGEQPTCHYTPQLAQTLLASYPEADLDGDGVLSRDEACELQAELRRHTTLVSEADPADVAQVASFVEEPLCCNSTGAGANSAPETSCPNSGEAR